MPYSEAHYTIFQHFTLIAFVYASMSDYNQPGLYFELHAHNKKMPPYSHDVEIWFPISGHAEYIDKNYRKNLLSPLIDITRSTNLLADQAQNLDSFHFMINQDTSARIGIFFVKLSYEDIERISEIINEMGALEMRLILYFSALYKESPQKTYNITPIFKFIIKKADWEKWKNSWIDWIALNYDLPRSVPEEVARDYREAVMAFNVGAWRASACMCRRSLQQALEDKGIKENSLEEEIDKALQNKIIDKSAASLAHGIRFFGNYGAHPQDDLLKDITELDARLAIDVLKQLLSKLYT